MLNNNQVDTQDRLEDVPQLMNVRVDIYSALRYTARFLCTLCVVVHPIPTTNN